jgi:hypothetical protein
MAVPKKKAVSAPAGLTPTGSRTFVWPFGRKNYILFGVALVVIAIGYVFLAQGSITLAPLLLVVGYCVLVPWAILAKNQPKATAPADNPDVSA